jgi:lysophospholipase L1-like esterase
VQPAGRLADQDGSEGREAVAEARSQSPQFGLGRSILYSLILIGLFFAVAEGGLRVWALFFREKVQRFDPATGTFVLVPGRHRTELGWVEINRDGFAGAELQAPGPDLQRIVAVGDSCTFGSGDAVNTYPAILGSRLSRRSAPGRRYEVVNAGISGLNSELALRRLESVVPALSPRVVTLYIGWNDLMKYDPAAQSESSNASRAARFVDELWLAKGLRKLLFFHLRPRLRPPATGPGSRSGRFAGWVPTYFEGNLRAMIERARAMGAQPLVATLPSVVRAEMTLDDVRRANVIFPYFPTAYGVGDLLDLIGAYNATIARVAGESGVPLADLAAHFASLPDVRPLFFDTMHTNPEGMAIIAAELEAALERAGVLDAAAPAAAPGG